MAHRIRRADYFYTTVRDVPGEAYRLLSLLAELGIGLLAFHAIPVGPSRTQFTLFPEDPLRLRDEGQKAGLALDGPHPAILVQGEDVIGALSSIHEQLYTAGVNVFASSGVASANGSYGYILYVRPEQYEIAASTLGV